MTLTLIHDKRHQGSPKKDDLIKRFRILKPGTYASVAVQAEADASNWDRAGVFDILTFSDSSRRSSAIVHSAEIPLNKEPFLIRLDSVEVRYFAFDPYRAARSHLNSITLRVWVETAIENLAARLPQGIETRNGKIIITL